MLKKSFPTPRSLIYFIRIYSNICLLVTYRFKVHVGIVLCACVNGVKDHFFFFSREHHIGSSLSLKDLFFLHCSAAPRLSNQVCVSFLLCFYYVLLVCLSILLPLPYYPTYHCHSLYLVLTYLVMAIWTPKYILHLAYHHPHSYLASCLLWFH